MLFKQLTAFALSDSSRFGDVFKCYFIPIKFLNEADHIFQNRKVVVLKLTGDGNVRIFKNQRPYSQKQR